MSGIINATNLEVANIKDSTGTNTAMTIASNGGVSGIATTLTEQATTSGTSIDFTVPNTAKVIYVGFLGCSFSGSNDDWAIRLGTSGGIVSSGYESTVSFTGGGATPSGANSQSTSSFPIWYSASAGNVVYGQVTITNMGGNKFTTQGNLRGGGYIGVSSGYVSLGGSITTVRVITQNGRTFDAGAVNVTYIE